ncbi:hypothetical protein L0Y46_01355 [bacterium]|nr:hypothetical protein [bacterium]MCI0679735.1 hypothetical protein [bacterium]
MLLAVILVGAVFVFAGSSEKDFEGGGVSERGINVDISHDQTGPSVSPERISIGGQSGTVEAAGLSEFKKAFSNLPESQKSLIASLSPEELSSIIDADKEKIIGTLMEKLPPSAYEDELDGSRLVLMGDSDITPSFVAEYGNRIAEIVYDHFAVTEGHELFLIQEMASENDTGNQGIPRAAQKYETRTEELLSMEVPEILQDAHMTLTNAFHNTSRILAQASFGGSVADLQQFLSVLLYYNQEHERIEESLRIMSIYFDEKNVHFKKGEPAYIFAANRMEE